MKAITTIFESILREDTLVWSADQRPAKVVDVTKAWGWGT